VNSKKTVEVKAAKEAVEVKVVKRRTTTKRTKVETNLRDKDSLRQLKVLDLRSKKENLVKFLPKNNINPSNPHQNRKQVMKKSQQLSNKLLHKSQPCKRRRKRKTPSHTLLESSLQVSVNQLDKEQQRLLNKDLKLHLKLAPLTDNV
jgi:hypothetical protein